MEDAEEIREDPEDWAEEEEASMDAEHNKRASRAKTASYRALRGILTRRVADRFLRRRAQ
jgi:hypothetical protein